MTEREAIFEAVLADPSEANRLVFADWLHDHGEDELARWFRQPHPPGELGLLSGVTDLPGDGMGYVYGYGYGYGFGNGAGAGDGYGYGYGEGYGEGYGFGCGVDRGDGYCEGNADGEGCGEGKGEPR